MSQQRSHRRRGMKTAAAGLTLAMAVAFAPGLFPGVEVAPVHAAQEPIDSPGEWRA